MKHKLRLNPSVNHNIWVFIGMLIFPISLSFFYSEFFNRKDYLIRKELKKWLLNNELRKPRLYKDNSHISGLYIVWDIDDYHIILDGDTWYIITAPIKLVLSSFNSGLFDRLNYNTILNILIAERQKIIKGRNI